MVPSRAYKNFSTLRRKKIAFEKERRHSRRFNSVPLLTQLTETEVASFLRPTT